ncbi:transposase [Deinococcus radiotolerans]|uniref:transposase n=1 Tax=Deinococcus radiotolerans TaxID=1309407 RepID=UPI001E4DDCEF|nr:transposase [Deinococcus radiotolerans]
MTRSAYPNDRTDAEWNVHFPLPQASPLGRPRKWSLREILDGIFYVLRSGITWREMPHDCPPWQTTLTITVCCDVMAFGSHSTRSFGSWSVSVRVAQRPPVPRSSTANR